MSIEVYRLSPAGEQLAHSYRSARSPEWSVIHFLNRRNFATKEQILQGCPSASNLTLARLAIRRLITSEMKVTA